jgi:hypothetical protein
MHYVQDLTQPYHASVSPGNSAARLIGINALAMVGLPKWKNEMIVLLSNRHLAMENYESALIRSPAKTRTPSVLGATLHDTSLDPHYPAWTDRYVRDRGQQGGLRRRRSHRPLSWSIRCRRATCPTRASILACSRPRST